MLPVIFALSGCWGDAFECPTGGRRLGDTELIGTAFAQLLDDRRFVGHTLTDEDIDQMIEEGCCSVDRERSTHNEDRTFIDYLLFPPSVELSITRYATETGSFEIRASIITGPCGQIRQRYLYDTAR